MMACSLSVSFRIPSRIDKQGNTPSERSQFSEGMAFWASKNGILVEWRLTGSKSASTAGLVL
jgi:hypothetical protein